MKIYRIKNSSVDIEPYEVFLDKLARFKEEELGLSEKKFEVPLKERIAYVLFSVFFLLSAILLAKIFYFQVFEGKKLYVEAENNKGSVNLVVPIRGIIYDKNMKKLVLNSPAYDLICDRARFGAPSGSSSDEINKEIKDIADTVGQDSQDVANKIQNTDSSEVLIADNIGHEQLLLLETKINDLQGCSIRQNTARDYVFGAIFSQVLGYTARINRDEYSSSTGYAINDYIGKTGLEKYYETYLRGKIGQSKPTKSISNFQPDGQIVLAPEPGDNLVLNIDADLQKQVYSWEIAQ